MSLTSIELQVISKILTSQDEQEINTLCEFDPSYYSIFKPHIEFILKHRDTYGNVPDPFTFQTEFQDVTLVDVRESMDYLIHELTRNKQSILLVETFNQLKELEAGDIEVAWKYLRMQCDKADTLDSSDPLDLVHDGSDRGSQVLKYSQQERIPTGFPEIDKAMYGGLSTVEELLILVARMGQGKSWVSVKMMESAQKNGFPVLYYSPEMQAAFLGTRFDTWRGHFSNSALHRGIYSEDYYEYLKSLQNEDTSAFVLENKDTSDGTVDVMCIRNLVRKHNIKLVIIDGLSYMDDVRGKRGDIDSIKYKNLCADLFQMSKKMHCAVVVVMQANRATKDNRDEKGDPFPNIYNIEGSDHPARIATQVFAMRQIFDKHVLDIRLEKSRNANNQKPEFSYAWDINTGTVQYLGDNSAPSSLSGVPNVTPDVSSAALMNANNIELPNANIILDGSDDIVEF